MTYEVLNVFEQMEPSEIQWLLATAQFEVVDAGSYILREGEQPLNIFFIADGLLEVSAYSGLGTVVKVGQLGPGDVVGEISWLDRKPASASVMATETGLVARLSMAMLEEKLEADPVFAAHFLRGIATLVAQRLRKTTVQLRGTSSASRTGPVAVAEHAIARCLSDFMMRANALSEALKGDRQIPLQETDNLEAAFRSLEHELHATGADTLSPGTSEAVRQELRPYLERSAIGARCVTRPRGHAGDFSTMQLIYAAEPTGTDQFGVHFDKYLLEMAGLRGIRGRLRLVSDALQAELRKTSDRRLVTCLGSGAAPEVFELLAQADLRQRSTVTCIDVDRESVALVEQVAKRTGADGHIIAMHANLLHLATGRDELGLDPQDLIYSVALLDALSDDAALAIVDWIYRKLKPGGLMIVGAIHPDNASRELMEGALEWRITHRSEADLLRLLQKSQFGGASHRFSSDPLHPGYLAIVSKT